MDICIGIIAKKKKKTVTESKPLISFYYLISFRCYCYTYNNCVAFGDLFKLIRHSVVNVRLCIAENSRI